MSMFLQLLLYRATPPSRLLSVVSGGNKLCLHCDKMLPMERFNSAGYVIRGEKHLRSECKACQAKKRKKYVAKR